ncbi:MAG: Na/Pi cotransporter family protein [Bacteroidaceae bacterium]|jgi:phosphate:Na+ symporter|nr:Na/Pi cotransporter family protein [Bacteroidaceae bacterium]
MITVIFKLLGSLALLMFGMKSMSEALQKLAGPQLRHVLGAMTTNRFTGIFTGMFVTAAVQSSTATTLMTVSFVNAGLLTLMQAISVIMGAHIGTTVTAWIMSLGFSFNIGDFAYFAFFIGIILIYMKSRRIVGDFLFGIAFLFLGLSTLKTTGADALAGEYAEAVQAFFANFNAPTIWNNLLFLVMGTVLTLCVQSSAAIMAITMTLCSTGVLHIDQGIMLVLGENIGTTITSNIVALTANVQARRAAFAHMSINVLGVIWVMILIKPFFHGVCSLVGFNPDMPSTDPQFPLKASVTLAAFHSAFNISNTLLLIWFVPYIERFVCWAIRPKPSDSNEDEDFRLKFISGGILSTAELSILEARKEINNYADRTNKMFQMVRELLETKEDKAFNSLFTRIEKYEGISDRMEVEIANYLNEVLDGRLSAETKAKIRAMLREGTEIESIGDSCYNLARSLQHRRRAKAEFTEAQIDHIHQMLELTNTALDQMQRVLITGSVKDALVSSNIELEINNYRADLKSQNFDDVGEGLYDYQVGVFYLDIINECEKLGDYVINVVEARTGTKKKN